MILTYWSYHRQITVMSLKSAFLHSKHKTHMRFNSIHVSKLLACPMLLYIISWCSCCLQVRSVWNITKISSIFFQIWHLYFCFKDDAQNDTIHHWICIIATMYFPKYFYFIHQNNCQSLSVYAVIGIPSGEMLCLLPLVSGSYAGIAPSCLNNTLCDLWELL